MKVRRFVRVGHDDGVSEDPVGLGRVVDGDFLYSLGVEVLLSAGLAEAINPVDYAIASVDE